MPSLTIEVCTNISLFNSDSFMKNSLAYRHPIIIAVWVALSSIFVQYIKVGWSDTLKVVPLFAAMAVPVMFLVDW